MMLDQLKNPPKKYRPIPFWSWNEKLDAAETRRQIAMMDEAGIGGYFMHARGGLQTEYMGEEWFENVLAGIDEGQKRGMGAWAYDENGWPSGFGSGMVNGLGEKYQQKYLRMEPGEKHTEHTICNYNGMHFYYEVNPFYVDNLDKEVVKVFIEKVYQVYYDKCGNGLEGAFTDEPQVSRNGIPWSLVLPEEYQKEYGEDLLPKLEQLFRPVGEYEITRMRFWRLVAILFSQAFSRQIYEWCDAHGLRLTGHLVLEENLEWQTHSNGAVMPSYEYYHIPAMDWLLRKVDTPIAPLQVSSVAQQMGKQQIMTESFALCGHNVSFSELRWILEWQMVHGINLLCPHLEGYSLRGIRKRDYPPAMYYQQPWWKDYKYFVDAMTRIGMLLAEGEVHFDTLMIHPQTTVWTCYDNDTNEGLAKCQAEFVDAMMQLERKHIPFHLGDEIMMERHAKVEGDTLVIGTQRYKTIVLPPHKLLFDNTKKLLAEFQANGGQIISAEEAIENPVINNPSITYTKREFKDFDLHYFVNMTKESQESEIFVGNAMVDLRSGEIKGFDGKYTFTPMDSIVVLDLKNKTIPAEPRVEKKTLPLDGQWEVVSAEPNAFVLDYCDCYFDGKLEGEHMHINTIQGRACALRRPVDVECIFRFPVEVLPKTMKLVCETPNIFTYTINGRPLEFRDEGYYLDSAFRTTDISGLVQQGENVISVKCHFVQSETTYENLEKSKIFESEKNKLTYEMEIEAMYLIGDFSVKSDLPFEVLDKDAVRCAGGFVISSPVKTVTLEHLEQQGYPFFAGNLTLRRKISLPDENYRLSCMGYGLNSLGMKVNGTDCGVAIWKPFVLDGKGFVAGENTVELTLTNNLRNLLGPHHIGEGESYGVGPNQFFQEPQIWGTPTSWNDGYCLVETSLKEE